MQALAQQAYGNVQQRTAGDKEIEVALIKQITSALENALESDEFTSASAVDAVSRNLQMWTIFATDLAGADNPLPEEAKASLISIAGYVRRETMKILSGEGDISDLIEVNRNLLTSLAGPEPRVVK